METSKDKRFIQLITILLGLLSIATVIIGGLLYTMTHPELLAPSVEGVANIEVQETPDNNLVENGLDVATGFVADGDYMLVKTQCTACHSSKLVLQNRATREGWKEMIVWMQETQKLWDLGENEDKILDYLAKHYAPEDQGRRVALKVDEWYEIE